MKNDFFNYKNLIIKLFLFSSTFTGNIVLHFIVKPYSVVALAFFFDGEGASR